MFQQVHQKRGFIIDSSLALYLPLWKGDGVSLMSEDAYGHICTVTGALWRPDGRYCDGVDDRIAATMTPPPGAMSLGGWVNVQNGASGAFLCLRNDDSVHTLRIEGTIEYKVAANNSRRWSYDARNAGWVFLLLTIPGNGQTDTNSAILYANAIEQTVISTTAVDTPSARNSFQIASESTGAYYLNCIAGDVFIFNRVLAPQEVLYLYQATKWRYR